MNALLHNYLIVGAILFALGAIGFLTRRNLIVMFLSAEMMLQGVSLNLVGFGMRQGSFQGQAFTIMILTIAACEAGLALALILTLYVRRPTLDVSIWQDLREPGQEPVMDEPPMDGTPSPTATYPTLTPAGHVPTEVETETPTHV